MSIFSPGLVLFDYDQEPQKTTEEERRGHKILRRSARLRALVERLDEIVRKSKERI